MMPIALIEATASGLPCVVHEHPILEWMTGRGGVRIDMAAPGQLSAALAGLLRAGSRTDLGRAAREHCVENFSRDAVVDKILDYYRRVLGHNSSRQFGAVEHGS
jgi:glycosyltransferase involved in cell wall biosynthesis